MTAFLLLTLYAPLASWGAIAVGEQRGSWDRPSRSAVLGLVAGAMGIERSDQADHDALDTGYGLAVRLDAPGSAFGDYHTAQSVAEAAIRKAFGKARPATRRALLSVAERETMLSRRELRQDALATAALWARAGARWPLETIARALNTPVFVPYAGRKANAFGLPLDPRIVECESIAAALAGPPKLPEETTARGLRPADGWGREVAFDDPAPDVAAGVATLRTEVRRDAGARRDRWQFAERAVYVGLLPLVEATP